MSPFTLLLNGYKGLFPRGWRGRSVKMANHFLLALRLKNEWSYVSTTLYSIMFHYGLHGNIFTFTFTFTFNQSQPAGRFTHSMPCPCRAHAIPLPCRAAKGLECVFPIWFTQCGRVWFTLAMPCSDHAFPLKATAQHGRRETARLCCGLEKSDMVGAWHGHGMASVNQTRPHCVNQMGKTPSKPLATRHSRCTARAVWARHAICESDLSLSLE